MKEKSFPNPSHTEEVVEFLMNEITINSKWKCRDGQIYVDMNAILKAVDKIKKAGV